MVRGKCKSWRINGHKFI